jgi:hypothetical protein
MEPYCSQEIADISNGAIGTSVGRAASTMENVVHSEEVGDESKLKVGVERPRLACKEIVQVFEFRQAEQRPIMIILSCAATQDRVLQLLAACIECRDQLSKIDELVFVLIALLAQSERM